MLLSAQTFERNLQQIARHICRVRLGPGRPGRSLSQAVTTRSQSESRWRSTSNFKSRVTSQPGLGVAGPPGPGSTCMCRVGPESPGRACGQAIDLDTRAGPPAGGPPAGPTRGGCGITHVLYLKVAASAAGRGPWSCRGPGIRRPPPSGSESPGRAGESVAVGRSGPACLRAPRDAQSPGGPSSLPAWAGVTWPPAAARARHTVPKSESQAPTVN